VPRRLITFAPGRENNSERVDMKVRCPRRGNSISDARLGLVSGLRYLLENGNS
jgi:hypothetical protein